MHHYPHHIGDYRRDTAHLTDDEDLAYRRMLELYYDTEAPLPQSAEWIARRIRMGTAIVERILSDFFTRDGEVWRQKRCDSELETYRKMVERNRDNGKLGGRPKLHRKTQRDASGMPVATQREPSGNPLVTQPRTSNQEPGTSNQVPEVPATARSARCVTDPAFDLFWDAYGKKVDKPTAERAWRKIAPNEILREQIVDAAKVYADATPDLQYRKNPATWLNARGWENDIVIPSINGKVKP